MERPCFAFQPRIPLWTQIQEYLKPQEKNEVRIILGEQLLSRNELMHEEVQALLQIVLEYRGANDNEVSNMEKERESLKRDRNLKGPALPEAPAKQLLKHLGDPEQDRLTGTLR